MPPRNKAEPATLESLRQDLAALRGRVDWIGGILARIERSLPRLAREAEAKGVQVEHENFLAGARHDLRVAAARPMRTPARRTR